MNRLFTLLLLLIYGFAEARIPVESLSLERAIKNRKIAASFNYTSGPQHQRVLGTFKNITRKGIEVDVPPGTMFEAEQSNWQNHVITKRTRFKLLPGKDTVVYFTAFCFERGDSGPHMGSSFKLITRKFPEGNRLCQMLDSLNDISYSAQTAIWQLYAGKTPNRIFGENKERVMLLRNYVGKVLKMEVFDYNPGVYVKHVRTARARPTHFHDHEEYAVRNIEPSDRIEIQLFSYEQDQLLSDIAFQSMLVQEKELCRFIYGIQMNGLQQHEKYIVRVMKNGVVHEEWLYKTT